MELIVLALVAGLAYLIGRKGGQKKTPSPFTSTVSSPPSISKLNQAKTDLSNITLSAEQQTLFHKMESTQEHLFITGKAGTGKSLLLQYFKQHSKKKFVVVAPTGVAALNVGAQTIHSLFRIPPTFIKKDSLSLDPRTATLLRNINTVVIDEISMVRADLMDAIDFRLRQARDSSVPFGGVQLIMFGDLYQLPPVVSDRELHRYFEDTQGGYFFFNADAWRKARFQIYELTYIFRQKDTNFKQILNAIREGEIDDQMLSVLNQRSLVEAPNEGVITLATTNSAVSLINQTHLNHLSGPLYHYQATISGDLKETEFPTEEILQLKKGAQVMLLKNDREKRWVNGTLGIVTELNDQEVKVSINDIVYSIPRESWKKVRYYYDRTQNTVEEETVSSFTQFPLRLAWAVTIHKSQGQTFQTIAIDMGSGAFAHGQTYVALSRCTTLEGLYLLQPITREHIIVEPKIIHFMKQKFNFD